MTSAFDQVRDRVDESCLSRECQKQGCEVGLAGVPSPFHLIDMDRPKSPAPKKGKKCDYLLVAVGYRRNGLYVVPLELKSKPFRAGAVSEQLAAGARVAERIVPKVPKEQRGFFPVVVHKGTHRGEINNLAKHPVRFRRDRYRIIQMECGDELAEHLKHKKLKA